MFKLFQTALTSPAFLREHPAKKVFSIGFATIITASILYMAANLFFNRWSLVSLQDSYFRSLGIVFNICIVEPLLSLGIALLLAILIYLFQGKLMLFKV